LGLLALAEALCLMTGNFDLSLESTLGFTAVVGAWLITGPQAGSGLFLNPLLAIIIVLCLGLGIGFANGTLVVKVGINPFLQTLAMLVLLRGLTYALTEAKTAHNLPLIYRFVGEARLVSIIPVSLLALGVIYTIAHIFFN